jgi:hypothetical protein
MQVGGPSVPVEALAHVAEFVVVRVAEALFTRYVSAWKRA